MPTRRTVKLGLVVSGALTALLTASDATARAQEYPTTCEWNGCTNQGPITCIDSAYVWCPRPFW